MKRGIVFVAAAAIVVAGALLWMRSRDSPPPSGSRLNVLLITIDTLRADRIGRGLTPFIDGVAARGMSFPAIRATVPLTLPSHVSLMTGTIPPVHGVRENGVVFDRQRPTIARVFRNAGYTTAAFVGAYVLNRRFGLDEGFDVYDDAVRRDAARMEQLEAERRGGEVVDAALRWLESRVSSREPFFLWVHLYDPHAPYAPPAEYAKQANGNGYDGEVAYADAQAGRLLDALNARGLTTSTIVAITGDHGEGLGEHGEQTHGMLVYDSTLRVPLVVAAPGHVATGNTPCHWELGPGLLRLAGLGDRMPDEMKRTTALLRRSEEQAGITTTCAGYSESMYPRRAGWHGLTTVADARWKLIASSEHELYDLQSDPGEMRNVAAERENTVRGMADMLSRMQPQRATVSQAAPEAAERLRALGYASGASPIASDTAGSPNPARVIAAWTEFERALGLLQDGKPSEAARALKPLAERHAGAPVFQSTYAQALRESGQPRAALAVSRKAVARWPNDASLFHDLAVAAREAGDPDEALRAEQAALALDANSAMALNGLGLLHADAGRHREAADAFERAVRIDAANASYWTNLGNARRALVDMPAAESAYRRALEIDARYADALNGLGVLLVQGGRASDAVVYFERALARDADFHEARLNLGIALHESGQHQRAIAMYRDLLARAPASAARERRAATDLLKQLRQP